MSLRMLLPFPMGGCCCHTSAERIPAAATAATRERVKPVAGRDCSVTASEHVTAWPQGFNVMLRRHLADRHLCGRQQSVNRHLHDHAQPVPEAITPRYNLP